jgi:hypothetical protein
LNGDAFVQAQNAMINGDDTSYMPAIPITYH